MICLFASILVKIRSITLHVGHSEIYENIDGKMLDRPEVRENLLTQLSAATFSGDPCMPSKNAIDPTGVIEYYAKNDLTIVLWQGASDIRILRLLLGAMYHRVKICNVTSHRADINSDKFELTLDCRESGRETIPFRSFPSKRGTSLSLTETHASVCGSDHGHAHDPLVDCRMCCACCNSAVC